MCSDEYLISFDPHISFFGLKQENAARRGYIPQFIYWTAIYRSEKIRYVCVFYRVFSAPLLITINCGKYLFKNNHLVLFEINLFRIRLDIIESFYGKVVDFNRNQGSFKQIMKYCPKILFHVLLSHKFF